MTALARSRFAFAALGALAAGVPLLALWGFSVDDALISARVATQIARGLGHRFNPDGPVVDAVTPLGFAWLLAPFAKHGPLVALAYARVLGASAWLAAAAWLGVEMARIGSRSVRFSPLLVLALCAPIAAWASSGMETGIVTALATFALIDARWSALIAGACAAWRPELLPWALVLGTGQAIAREKSAIGAFVGLSLALAPAALVALGRTLLFGSPTPLSAIAKPSDWMHGAAYAILALVFTGAAALLLAPRALRRLSGHQRAIAVASLVHFAALIAAGGDWMVLHRLAVPVLPGMLLVGSAIAEHSALPATILRTLIACALSLLPWLTQVAAARSVLGHRLQLIAAARPALAGAERVAAVDVGWVGAATEAHVVDLAGVTDPNVARLAGGHTTKRIQEGFLRARGVDAVVLRLEGQSPATPWTESRFAYGVEPRIARQADELGLAPAAVIPLGGSGGSYLVLRAAPLSTSAARTNASRMARASR